MLYSCHNNIWSLFYTGLQWRYVKMSKLDLCAFLYVWSRFRVTSYLTRDVILRFNVGLVQTLSLYWATAVYANILPLIFFYFHCISVPYLSIVSWSESGRQLCPALLFGEVSSSINFSDHKHNLLCGCDLFSMIYTWKQELTLLLLTNTTFHSTTKGKSKGLDNKFF